MLKEGVGFTVGGSTVQCAVKEKTGMNEELHVQVRDLRYHLHENPRGAHAVRVDLGNQATTDHSPIGEHL
jgi:hypothetical protein